jgi:hypothetical protein
MPIIVSHAQGSGKTTFGEVICKGLFGEQNVIVTDQYDGQARFNSDYADKLIVCNEEKEHTDRHNPASVLKSKVTATQIRKENKGVDPIYQASYTEYIQTSNSDVPVRFEDSGEQRRFMVMGADESFTRKNNPLAEEVFTKLYGIDKNDHVIDSITPFTKDVDLIAQFKHELFTRKDIAAIQLKQFPKTEAYKKCYSIPRTSEAVEIDEIMRGLQPFIKATLKEKRVITHMDTESGEHLELSNFMHSPNALAYMPGLPGMPGYVALCRPVIFFDDGINRPMKPAVVGRALEDCSNWLKEEGLVMLPDNSPLPGGFKGINTVHRNGNTARFALAEEVVYKERPSIYVENKTEPVPEVPRKGMRLRYNKSFQPDPAGEFETVNEIKDGLPRSSKNVQYMDTFLLEADETTKHNYSMEEIRGKKNYYGTPIQAASLYIERLGIQTHEAERLYDEGIVARIVASGSKSIHMLVRVDDAPNTIEEYKWLHAYLCQTLSDKLIFDPQTNDPSRLTRAPATIKRETTYMDKPVVGMQCLIKENWKHVYRLNWRALYEQWKNRPQTPYESSAGNKNVKLVPTRPEYEQAYQALLCGTFWTDPQWNGRRQQCFFPAYRLCRLSGYSHDQLWAMGGILDGLENYKKPEEINYWRAREFCDLIKQIDIDVDEQTKEEAK